MKKPSSTIQASGIAGALASTLLLALKLTAPEIYAQIPNGFHGHLVTIIAFVVGWAKRERVLSERWRRLRS